MLKNNSLSAFARNVDRNPLGALIKVFHSKDIPERNFDIYGSTRK